MGKKKSALTAAVILGVGLAATPAFSQSAPGGKSVPPDLDRTPTTPGREQQLPPSGREIPKGTEGMSASDIKQVQQALKAKGHDAGTSGVMDDKTRSAIRAFQKSEGLTMTGTVDEKTAQALGLPAGQVRAGRAAHRERRVPRVRQEQPVGARQADRPALQVLRINRPAGNPGKH
jgi:peptidoglycan hydrolase-like protein with peptidoglycan-binding domain